MVYIFFILGFVLLIKGADLLVDGSAAIAKRFGLSNLIIGLTIVSFGTSMPELIVSTFSAWQGASSMAFGNVIGSNIANILLILGVSAAIFPLVVHFNTVWKEIPLSLLAALVVLVLANDVMLDETAPNLIGLSDGLILLAFFTIFLAYIISMSLDEKGVNKKKNMEVDEIQKMPLGKGIILVILGMVGLALGGNWIVDGGVEIARFFNVSEAMIGLTIIAIGTSLPELAASAMAALKKHSDIAIGNVVGSNIFNICWVLGLTALIRPVGVELGLNVDIWIMILASVLLFVFMYIGKKHILQKWQGYLFIVMFVGYIGLKIITA